MSALGVPVLINPNKSYWLSSIGTDVIHSTIVTDTIDANLGNISTLNSDYINASTLNVSSLNAASFDVSGMYVSSIRGNTAFFSTVTLASDLSGGVGYVRFSVDASGIQVDGDPIRFDNLVYLTSTINIVQVSTIVDTDIFAQRGFFSTLSSGIADIKQGLFSSIICYDISGQNGSFDRLFVSTLEALDISGVAASNWSLFPTLNSTITFQPGYVLSNVGPSLYFAGVELTDVSGGGQDWSRFPAFSTVNMNNNSMGGLSTLTYQDGGRLYSVTGNNLFYNGQQINSGAGGAASNWAQYPANGNVNINGSNLSNAALIAGSNLTLSGSNITNGNTFTNSLGVGGTSLISLATINSLGQGVLQDLDVGSVATSIGDLNVYGVNALPGDNALYVVGGTTLTGGGIVHGTEIGALTVAGIDTVRIDVLPAGMGLNSATYIQLAAVGAGSFAAGGALSLAGGDYVEVNTDDFRVINTTSGNQSTTLTVANIQMPASVAATVPLQINNTAGGGINLVGTSGVGQIAGFSSIAGDNLVVGNSTVTTNLTVNNRAAANTLLWSVGLGVSTVSADSFGQRVWVSDSVIGATNIGPIDARIYNFSSIQSGTMSTIDIRLSTINGVDWNDISGGSGGSAISSFQTLTTSSINVSSINQIGGTSIKIAGTLAFASPNSLLNCVNINDDQALTLNLNGNIVNLGGNNNNAGSLSTLRLQGSRVKVSTLEGVAGVVDVSGGMFVADTIELPLATGGINFDDGTGTNYTRLMRRDIANNNMLAVVNNTTEPAPEQINMMPLAVGELWLTGSSDQYQACRLYSVFPFGNYELDAIDADGATLFAYMQGYENGLGLNPGFLQAYSNVSSISGYDQESAANQMLHVINGLTTSNLIVSSINGASPGSGGMVTSSFTQLYTSSFEFSTATSVGSNTNFNYPIFLDYDVANNVSTAGVAIAVQNHNYATGAVVNRIEMGARANGNNYIMSVWPGNNLEDLYIDATDTTFNDGTISTIINTDPYGLVTNRGISAPQLFVSSINGNDPRPAYTNNLQLSTMELYNGSTTLMYWDSTTTHENINTSGYDVVVGVNGNYKIGTSFQFLSGGAPNTVEFFVLKNGSVISQSGGVQSVQTLQEIVSYVEIVEPLVNGDTIEIGCFTNGSGVFVSTVNGSIIQSPACILTMYRVD